MSTLAEVKAFQKRERAKRKAGRTGPKLPRPAEARLSEIVRLINAYSRRTHREEYTDVGDAWELFHLIRGIAKGKT